MTGTHFSTSGLSNVFLAILALRILNALTIRTFFQPDEYFQSLEPAWNLTFGRDAGAWITWEWKSQLRSSIHPAIFAAVYRLISSASWFGQVSPFSNPGLLLAAPKVFQACSGALCDYYTWRFTDKVYGQDQRSSWFALILTLCSPWQWFCSTRTLSNCLETTLTVFALYSWPWSYFASSGNLQVAPAGKRSKVLTQPPLDAITFRNALLAAAVACILRPTNVLIWICIAFATLVYAVRSVTIKLLRESVIYGLVVLGYSAISDRFYYGVWTLPPLRFLYFNIAQSLAVFYGRNRTDYYLTEGLPLLLTTALPFALTGLWWSVRPAYQTSSTEAVKARARNDKVAVEVDDELTQRILAVLSGTVIFVTFVMSCISHKEVRFLYPLLPALHVLAARPLDVFARPTTPTRDRSLVAQLTSIPLLQRTALLSALAINVLLAYYTTQVHQRGVIDVLTYIRDQHASRHSPSPTPAHTSVGFLMPCHSTPWRSHLIYPEIDAWALTCEPPLDVPLDQRDQYVDEADVFYMDPLKWLGENMEGERGRGRKWPGYLVFFEQLEPQMREMNYTVRKGHRRYEECWRGFNSHFHDDWRRVGDVVVWCDTQYVKKT